MTFESGCGPICPAERARWDGQPKTTAALSTPSAGSGAPWRDLPPDYGEWKNTHRRFCRWRDRGEWARLLEAVMDDPDFEWLMIDASYIKAHPHSAGARGGSQAIARTKGG